LDNALLDTIDDNEMIRKRNWTHVWLNWIQIQLKRIKIQLHANGIENLLIIHDYDIEKKKIWKGRSKKHFSIPFNCDLWIETLLTQKYVKWNKNPHNTHTPQTNEIFGLRKFVHLKIMNLCVGYNQMGVYHLSTKISPCVDHSTSP